MDNPNIRLKKKRVIVDLIKKKPWSVMERITTGRDSELVKQMFKEI